MKTITAFLIASTTWAADIVFSGSTQAQLQTEINAAACGDRFMITAGQTVEVTDVVTLNKTCAVGNEFTFTTTEHAKMPLDSARILPSYAALMPTLSLATNTANFRGIIYVPANAAGIIIRGIRFQTTPYDATNAGFNTTPWGIARIGAWDRAQGSTDAATRITLKHCLFSVQYFTNQDNRYPGSHGATIWATGCNDCDVYGNWVQDLRGVGEQQAVLTQFAKMVRVTNNFFAGGQGMCFMAITPGVYTGTPAAPFPQPLTEIPQDFTVAHNTCYQRTYWMTKRGINQDGTGATSRSCGKNNYELKTGLRMSFLWNSGYNQYSRCESQYTSFVMTPRQYAEELTCSVDNTCRATLSSTTVTFATAPATTPVAGGWILVATTASPSTQTDWEARQVVSCSSSTVCTVASAYSSALSPGRWMLGPAAEIDGSNIYGNITYNTPFFFNIQGDDFFFNIPSTGRNIRAFNNLLVNNSATWAKFDEVFTAPDFNNGAFETANIGSSYGGTGSTMLMYNTYADETFPAGITQSLARGMRANGAGIGVTLANNIMPRPEFGNIVRDATAEGAASINAGWNTNSIVRRNAIGTGASTGNYEPCSGGRVCAQNFIATTDQAVYDANFGIASGALKSAGDHGRDIGADPRDVPQIRGLTVTPGSTGQVTFAFSVTEPIMRLSCQIEITSTDLTDHPPTYTLAYTLGTRGDHVTIPANESLQRSKTFTGVTTGTRYYRVMCGGAVATGSYTQN